MTTLLLAIDGTGPWNDREYSHTMWSGFVSRIYDNARGSKHYQRGPSFSGIESGIYGAASFLQYVKAHYQLSPTDHLDVFIVGFSRGAMIAMYIANRIHQYNTMAGFLGAGANSARRLMGFEEASPQAPISIAGMLLFDSVDSDATMYGPGIRVVPPSVRRVSHYICRGASRGAPPSSRSYFERIKLECHPPSRLNEHYFYCTHAAIGGFPGGGDYSIPTDATEVVAAGVKRSLRPSSLASPMLAAARFASGAGETAWNALRSDVTLEQDFEGFKAVEQQVRKDLVGWPVTGI